MFLSEARLVYFRAVATSFLLLPSPPACMWQQVLGHMASQERFLPRGHSHMRPLLWRLKVHWYPLVDDPAVQIPLSQQCVEAVRWWLQEDRWVFGVPLQVPPPSLLMHTDVSLLGWGAHLLYLTALCVWSKEEGSVHMMAVYQALATLLPQLSGQSVVLLTDNTTVVASLRHQDRTVFRVLCHVTSEIVLCSVQKNVLVILLSPNQILLMGCLIPRVFEAICGVFGCPHLILFAAHTNVKLHLYVSPVPDPRAWKQDSFQHPWGHLLTYALPLFALLRQVFSRVLLST